MPNLDSTNNDQGNLALLSQMGQDPQQMMDSGDSTLTDDQKKKLLQLVQQNPALASDPKLVQGIVASGLSPQQSPLSTLSQDAPSGGMGPPGPQTAATDPSMKASPLAALAQPDATANNPLLAQQIKAGQDPSASPQGTSPLLQLSGQQQPLPSTPNNAQNNLGNLSGIAQPSPDMPPPDQAKPYDTPLLRQYADYISKNTPNPEDYKPSMLRQISAHLSGISAGPAGFWGGVPVGMRSSFNPEVERQINQQPYQNALMGFKAKAGALGEGAQIEEKNITNQRQIQQEMDNAQWRRSQVEQAQQTEVDRHSDRIELMKNNVDKANGLLEQAQKKVESLEKIAGQKSDDFNTRTQAQADAKAAATEAAQRKAELVDATHRLEIATKDKESANNLLELTRKHNQEQAKADADRAVAQQRADTAEAALKAKSSGAVTTTEKTEKEPPWGPFGLFGGGTKKSTETTQVKTPTYTNPNPAPASSAAPPLASRVIGRTTFKLPNGKIGTWDGTSWVVP